MSQTIQTEAIVLHVLNFKDYDRILTLFSPQGLVKLFVKIKKRDYLHFAALTSVLTQAEFFYTQGKKDLHRLFEGTIVSQHLRIREHYETLIASNKIIQALLKSQWPGKAAPKLFQLFTLFLKQLPDCREPSTFSCAFLLKIMKHEGLLQLNTPLEANYRFAGESYPLSEAPRGACFFSQEEEELFTKLALCRSLSLLSEQSLPLEFQAKVETLFSQIFNYS